MILVPFLIDLVCWLPVISCSGKCFCVILHDSVLSHHQNCHVCLFYESIETGCIKIVCFTYIPKLNPVSDSKPKPVSTNGSRPKFVYRKL